MPNEQDLVASVAAAIQQEGLTWEAGPTKLTEASEEERSRVLGVRVTPEERQHLEADLNRFAAMERTRVGAAVGAPAAIDWRNVGGQNYITSIKDQGYCGSCVAFCSCATIESAMRIKLGNPSYAVDLSEAFLFFCGGGDCDNGWGLTDGLDYAKSTGTTDNACMPYAQSAFNGTNMNCTASRCADWQNRLTKIAGYTGSASMAARKDAVAIRPQLAGMAVYNDFFALKGGVYVKTASAILKGYHCISVIGYDDTQQCWIIKNSWGTTWGENGFGKIRYNQADLLIDTSWGFYSPDPTIPLQWHNNVAVVQTYASRDSQNAWAYIQGLGWRKIQTGAADGVTNMLALFAEAVANGRNVTVYADGTFVYQAYML